MIRLNEVSKTYRAGKTFFAALQNITLQINKGEFVALLGPSGSGKSTLMHLIGGLDRPTSGTVEVAGLRLDRAGEAELAFFRNRKVGFVFQFFNLLPHLSALDNIALPLVYGRVKADRKLMARKVLDLLGLREKYYNRPTELSGGEQQRVAIARAILNDPEIVLADEPTGNLDSQTGKQIIEILAVLNRMGKTVLIVTHDKEIASYASRTILLKDGHLEKL